MIVINLQRALALENVFFSVVNLSEWEWEIAKQKETLLYQLIVPIFRQTSKTTITYKH